MAELMKYWKSDGASCDIEQVKEVYCIPGERIRLALPFIQMANFLEVRNLVFFGPITQVNNTLEQM